MELKYLIPISAILLAMIDRGESRNRSCNKENLKIFPGSVKNKIDTSLQELD